MKFNLPAISRQLVPAWLVLILGTGCSTSYWKNRGRDAADMITASAGIGIAAHVRLGPLPLGVVHCSDQAGLRYGSAVLEPVDKEIFQTFDNRLPLSMMVAGSVAAAPFVAAAGAVAGANPIRAAVAPICLAWDFAAEHWDAYEHLEFSALQKRRGKDRVDLGSASAWRVEVCAGVGFTARAGINLAEILDFILGFSGLDPMRDDVGDS